GQSITLGLCLPDICDKDDLKVLVLAALEELKQQAPVTTNCQPVEAPSPDAAAICVICLLSLVAFVVLAATLYDILIYQPVLLCPPDEVLLPQTPPEPLLTEPSTNDAGQHRSTLDVTDYTPLLEREDVAEEHAKFVQSNTNNLVSFMSWLRDISFQVIINASVSVDSFFFLSGTLVSYLLLREMAKCEGPMKVSWLKFYFHRYW
uniref:Nose resistant-to-fluoxetine protein N-terminal domain-containing protein n=2 Tax=Capitella teleta TaxID=283909 RepID=X2A5Q6_CAPTE